MAVGKWLLMAVLAAVAAQQLWQAHEHTVAERGLLAFEDTNGFVPVQTAAKRADTMANRLTELRIPNTRAVDEVTSEFRGGK